MPKSHKLKKPPEPHWKIIVQTYLDFCSKHYSDGYKMDGKAARNLKSLVGFLREQAQLKGAEWTVDIAARTLGFFMEFAYRNRQGMTGENFFMVYLNVYKEEILEQIKEFKKAKQHGII